MLYQARLESQELCLLADLIGTDLELIKDGGWDIEIQSNKSILSVFPEEVAIPDDEHDLAPVDRPQIKMIQTSQLEDTPALATRMGKVVSVTILSLLAGFTPRNQMPATKFLNTEIPAGSAYGYFYFRHEFRAYVLSELGDKQALIDWDIGIEIVTERIPSIVLYTKGYFVRASLEGLPEQDWAEEVLLRRRPLRIVGNA